MCRVCRAKKAIERIERQIKAIDTDNAINPAILREVLSEAAAELTFWRRAGDVIGSMIEGTGDFIEISTDTDKDSRGHVH